MKNLFNMTGQGQYGVMQDGRQMGRDGQQRQGGYQGGRGYQGGQGGRKGGNQYNNRGGPRGNNMRQGGGNRDYAQSQGQPMNPVMQQQMQGMTPDQAAQMQQQMLAQQQQQQMLPAVDIGRLNAMDPAERRQEIGNNIYSVIQQIYGDAAGKITGMLLDNDRIVDPIQLVTNMTYLQ